MPVEILMSSGWIETVGSEATDLGGSLSIVNTNAAPASAKATPNSLILCIVFPFGDHPPRCSCRSWAKCNQLPRVLHNRADIQPHAPNERCRCATLRPERRPAGEVVREPRLGRVAKRGRFILSLAFKGSGAAALSKSALRFPC